MDASTYIPAGINKVFAFLDDPANTVSDDLGAEDEDALRRHLARLSDWASNEDLPTDQHWRAAAQALAAGRQYE